jgi:opacity protein-like surface antigen
MASGQTAVTLRHRVGCFVPRKTMYDGAMRIAVLVLLLASAAGARAADQDLLYLYGAAGSVRTDPGINQADTDALIQAGGATNPESSVNNIDTGFKVQVGWMLSRHFAFEAGYAGLGSSRYRATFTDGSAKVDFKAGGIVFDILGLAPVGGDVSLYGKAGLIAANVVTTLTVAGPTGTTTRSSTNNSTFRPNYGVGVIYDVSKIIKLRFEVERFANLANDASSHASNMDMISLGLMLRL